MTDDRVRSETSFRPWKLRAGTPLDERRHELAALAAPVFKKHGFRGATVKALAHACHLSPAGLYHYFRSKEELATYLLRHPRLDWDSTYVDQRMDPLLQLRELIDLSIRELPAYLLAIQLAHEIGGTGNASQRQAGVREGEAVYGRILMAVDPSLSREVSAELARQLLALLAGSAFTALDAEWEPATRSRMIALVRSALVPSVVEPERFDRLMDPDSE